MLSVLFGLTVADDWQGLGNLINPVIDLLHLSARHFVRLSRPSRRSITLAEASVVVTDAYYTR